MKYDQVLYEILYQYTVLCKECAVLIRFQVVLKSVLWFLCERNQVGIKGNVKSSTN